MRCTGERRALDAAMTYPSPVAAFYRVFPVNRLCGVRLYPRGLSPLAE